MAKHKGLCECRSIELENSAEISLILHALLSWDDIFISWLDFSLEKEIYS